MLVAQPPWLMLQVGPLAPPVTFFNCVLVSTSATPSPNAFNFKFFMVFVLNGGSFTCS
jgi:hypothetical protein